jgi:hypothetical protein
MPPCAHPGRARVWMSEGEPGGINACHRRPGVVKCPEKSRFAPESLSGLFSITDPAHSLFIYPATLCSAGYLQTKCPKLTSWHRSDWSILNNALSFLPALTKVCSLQYFKTPYNYLRKRPVPAARPALFAGDLGPLCPTGYFRTVITPAKFRSPS